MIKLTVLVRISIGSLYKQIEFVINYEILVG